MKRSVFALLVIAVVGVLTMSACSSGAATPGTVTAAPEPSGNGAPGFIGTTFDGNVFDLSDHAGKPVVINFWFPSCPPCKAELPDMQAAYEKYGAQGVEFVGVQQLGIDSALAGRQFWADLGVTFPAFPDQNSKVQAAFGVLSYPTTIFLDSDHNIARKWTGLIDREALEKNIEAILGS
jgi:peroxiredoxin